MNEILKQRLVGALILVALGIVFWPIIFVQPAEETAGLQQPIPSRPGVSTQTVGAPDEAGLRGSVKRSVEKTVEVTAIGPIDDISDGEMNAHPTASASALKKPTPAAPSTRGSTRSEAPQPLAIDSDGVPVAWILQVVSVSSKDKAEMLRLRLVNMNIKAYVKSLNSGSKKLYRVYVGPKFERAKLEQLQAQIDNEFGVTSMVARYSP
ncbi:MAG: SPOR domain-containing protein [Halioglobus sp.]|nr:SPOR domain-containing protein [Halioglobus sp.]